MGQKQPLRPISCPDSRAQTRLRALSAKNLPNGIRIGWPTLNRRKRVTTHRGKVLRLERRVVGLDGWPRNRLRWWNGAAVVARCSTTRFDAPRGNLFGDHFAFDHIRVVIPLVCAVIAARPYRTIPRGRLITGAGIAVADVVAAAVTRIARRRMIDPIAHIKFATATVRISARITTWPPVENF